MLILKGNSNSYDLVFAIDRYSYLGPIISLQRLISITKGCKFKLRSTSNSSTSKLLYFEEFFVDIMLGMKQGKVILICGLPGSGKSTLARKLEADEGAIRFTPDEWMEAMGISLWDGKAREGIEQRFWRLAQELALRGSTIILENGFWSKKERDGYLKMARGRGFKIELRALYIPKEEARKRLEVRDREGDERIVKEKLDKYYELFETPNEEELSRYDT